jgi:hypothetical protein
VNRLIHAGALALAAVLATSAPASAGSIIITGHDTDDHNASTFMNWALTALLNGGNGTTLPSSPVTGPRIAYLGNGSANLSSYFGFYDNFAFYDLDNVNWVNVFTESNAVIVVGSGFDFVSAAGSAAMNGQAAAFATYFNAGGHLFVNTEQGLGQSFYGFIPSFGGTLANSLPGCFSETGTGTCMNVTAQGTTRGHTLGQIVNADITHTRFTTVSPSFEVLSTYVNNGGAGTGSAITIGLFNASIDNGNFTPVPEPTTLTLIGSALAMAWRRRRR